MAFHITAEQNASIEEGWGEGYAVTPLGRSYQEVKDESGSERF